MSSYDNDPQCHDPDYKFPEKNKHSSSQVPKEVGLAGKVLIAGAFVGGVAAVVGGVELAFANADPEVLERYSEFARTYMKRSLEIVGGLIIGGVSAVFVRDFIKYR